MALPAYIPLEDKLPWFQAVCVVLPQLPYPKIREACLRPYYKGISNPLAGFCYTASEAIFHLSEDEMHPYCVRYGALPHQTHWYLKLVETGEIVDVTGSQFSDMDAYALYDHGVRKGFLTKQPSKRARAILDRINRRVYWVKRAMDYSPYGAEKRYEDAKKGAAEIRAKRKARDSNPHSR